MVFDPSKAIKKMLGPVLVVKSVKNINRKQVILLLLEPIIKDGGAYHNTMGEEIKAVKKINSKKIIINKIYLDFSYLGLVNYNKKFYFIPIYNCRKYAAKHSVSDDQLYQEYCVKEDLIQKNYASKKQSKNKRAY